MLYLCQNSTKEVEILWRNMAHYMQNLKIIMYNDAIKKNKREVQTKKFIKLFKKGVT